MTTKDIVVSIPSYASKSNSAHRARSIAGTMARCTALLAALLLPAHAIRPSSIARRDALNVAPPAIATFLAKPAWARYDDYKEGPRGLKYIVTETGEGATPQRGQSVKAEYTLTLDGFSEDGGRVVDSSKGFMKGPFAFYAGTGGVIKGWDLVRGGVLFRPVNAIAAAQDTLIVSRR